MTSLEIKFQVYKKWGSITAAARNLHCSRSQLSYCISRRRLSLGLRERLAAALDTAVKELFDDKPAADTLQTEAEATIEAMSEPAELESGGRLLDGETDST